MIRYTVADTLPTITIYVEKNSEAVVITGATITLEITRPDATTTSLAGTITSGTGGIVTFTPAAGTFNQAGWYYADLKIVFAAGAGTQHGDEPIKLYARAQGTPTLHG